MSKPIAMLCLAGCALAACASPARVGSVRFHNQPPVWQVNDRTHVAEKPEEHRFSRMLYFFDAFVYHKLTQPLELEAQRHALGVNAVDEVPDSTWFTNRIGHQPMTAADVARGPRSNPGPKLPLTVTGSKIGGKAVGFIAEDAGGDRFVIKFDPKEHPVIETAADVVVQRLLWAFGYNVPLDSIVELDRADLELAPDATVANPFGNARPMTIADLETALARVNRSPDGSYRALASRFIPGESLGGTPGSGVRADDPNDRIPHQHRRELRGLKTVSSWLKATDIKVDNTLDTWVEDPADPDRRYVVHYLIDFGKSLGANASIPVFAPDGYQARLDYEGSLRSMLALGAWKRPWEGTPDPDLPGVGMFDVAHFDPSDFEPQQPYRPFDLTDRHDAFWAAKKIVQFSPAMIRAAVEQGRYPDPRSVDYLTRVLIGRQQKLARYWFRQVNPIDRVEVTGGHHTSRVCFSDLLLAHGLATAAERRTRWRAEAYDREGRSLGWRSEQTAPAQGGEVCFDDVTLSPSHDGYTIIRIDTDRAGPTLPPVELHLARAASGRGQARLIGLIRQ